MRGEFWLIIMLLILLFGAEGGLGMNLHLLFQVGERV
jgi:hypothetical protein